jgi:hypothetical protein
LNRAQPQQQENFMTDTTENAIPATEPPIGQAGVDTPPAPPRKPAGGIARAALILGIVAFVLAVIPGPSFVAFLPALAAAALGVIALVKRYPRRGLALSGVILGAVALFIAVIVSIVAIVAGAAGVSHRASDNAAPTVSASAEPAKSAEPSATPTVEPAAPVAPVVPADTTYSGTGDSVIAVVLPDGVDNPSVATLSHTGKRNFAVWSLDTAMAHQDLLVNTIGAYAGTVTVDFKSGEHTSSLEINADGPWTVTFHSLKALREFAGATASGSGDDVLVYRGKAGAAAITNAGERNFAVWSYGSSTDLLVNEIGAYTGTVRWMAGNSVIAVTSSGAWTITVQ